jgi:hypothetical protein
MEQGFSGISGMSLFLPVFLWHDFLLVPHGTRYIESTGAGQLFGMEGIISLLSAIYQKREKQRNRDNPRLTGSENRGYFSNPQKIILNC